MKVVSNLISRTTILLACKFHIHCCNLVEEFLKTSAVCSLRSLIMYCLFRYYRDITPETLFRWKNMFIPRSQSMCATCADPDEGTGDPDPP